MDFLIKLRYSSGTDYHNAKVQTGIPGHGSQSTPMSVSHLHFLT
jgi:hypothetical protein